MSTELYKIGGHESGQTFRHGGLDKDSDKLISVTSESDDQTRTPANPGEGFGHACPPNSGTEANLSTDFESKNQFVAKGLSHAVCVGFQFSCHNFLIC